MTLVMKDKPKCPSPSCGCEAFAIHQIIINKKEIDVISCSYCGATISQYIDVSILKKE